MELQHGNRTAPGAVAKRIKNSSGGKSVVVLKKGDVTIRNEIVYMPNTIEMAQLKKPAKGQFRRQVPIDSDNLTAEHVENLLKEYFPCLKGQRLYCAAAVNNRTKLDFHGIPRIWDGSFIKRKIKGNSALYIFAEESGRPSIFDSHTCIPEQAAPIWSQGQFVSQGSGDLVQPIGMGSLEPEIQGPPITGLLSNYFVCHSSVAPAMTPEVNQAFLFLSETNSSPQDENPLNGGPNTGTHSTTSYLCPNNASQMFPTLSDSWHQELSELDSANVPSSDFDSGWQDDGNGLPCDRDLVSSDLDSMLPLFGDQNFTSSSMNIVDGQSSMEIHPEGTVHQDQVGADCNGNSPTEEFDSLTTATDLNIKSRNSSQECDLDHSVVQRIIPPSGSVEGGYPFVIALSEPLPGQVNFGEAKFHGVATVNLEKLNNHTFSGTVPRCHLAEPGIVEVTVMTQTGQRLGTTSFEYVDELTKIAKEITVDHGKQAKFFSKLSEEHKVLSGSSLQSKQQHSLQFLQFLVYTASQTGAKTFIEIIFSTSAGQIVFDSYKDRTCLPEDVARASGHDELANYLQDLTTRFSKEPEFSQKEAHVIDWSELEAAAIAAQTQGCLTEEKSSDDSSENNSDTDYFADVETSSVGSSELSRSTSEDDTSEPNSRDKTKASAHQSISSIGKWAFAGNGTMGKIGQIKEVVKQKSCVLMLRDSQFDSSLPEVVKGLDYTLAFHLAIGSKNIPCHLHTVNERFLVLRESITRQPTMSFCNLHPYPDVLKESSLVKNNKGLISNTVASKQRHWNQLNEDIVAELGTLMPIEKDIAVEWKSSGTFGKEFGAHTHCDLWVFTSAFRPTRKTFFVYFADRRNALPHSYFFEDEDCESQVRCWKWKRSGNNSLKFTESVKEKKLPPGREKSQMESDVDLPVTYIVRDKQAQTPSESGICLSWMHAMMHHCWTTESTEKASNITIFDHFLGPDTDGSLAEDILYRTIKIGEKEKKEKKESSSILDVLQATCALLNSGGGVVHMKIADFHEFESPLAQLDTFWQKLERKLDAMIKPSEYAEVFDRVVEKDVILLLVKAPGHCCTVEFNLFLAGDTKKTEASFKETVRLLQDRPLGKRKDFCRIPLQELPSLPESFPYEQKLDFHESKHIQFKCFPSKNPLLHVNSKTQRKEIVHHISAFGNCSGGIILVGVRNDGTVLGQDMSSKENSREDIESRIRSLIEDMKWPCICERKVFWDIKFLPVEGKENCFVIAIYVAGIKGGVFSKNPKSYELRLEDDGKQQSISHLEFVEWKKRMLSGEVMLQHERRAVQELSKKLDSLSLPKGPLLTVKGSVGRIIENFLKVEEGCPVSPKDFVQNLPKVAQEVVERIQEISSPGRSRALLVGSPLWRACVSNKSDVQGESLSVDGVICDLLLFNRELGGLHLFTLCDTDRVDGRLLSYSLTTAKALKKALVIQGGCKEKFYVTPHVVPCRAPERQIRQICQICPDSPYPGNYKLQEHRAKINKILESLVIVLATIPSALSSRQGVSFFNLLTKEQFQLLYQEIDRFKELWIKGAAGTGKTVVAVELIKELRRRDPDLKQDEILYVCDNRGLREQISKLQICKFLHLKSFMSMGEYQLREVKHVIMDEVQSFGDEDRKPGEENWLQKARRLVRQKSGDDDPGYLWLFIDKRQIHHLFPTVIPPEKEQKPWFNLTKIIRNSKRIVDNVSKMLFGQDVFNEIEMGHDFEGEKVSVKSYQEGNEVFTLRKVIKSLRTKGYSDGDNTILFSEYNSIPKDLESELENWKSC